MEQLVNSPHGLFSLVYFHHPPTTPSHHFRLVFFLLLSPPHPTHAKKNHQSQNTPRSAPHESRSPRPLLSIPSCDLPDTVVVPATTRTPPPSWIYRCHCGSATAVAAEPLRRLRLPGSIAIIADPPLPPPLPPLRPTCRNRPHPARLPGRGPLLVGRHRRRSRECLWPRRERVSCCPGPILPRSEAGPFDEGVDGSPSSMDRRFQGSGRAAGDIFEGRRADLSETGSRGW